MQPYAIRLLSVATLTLVGLTLAHAQTGNLDISGVTFNGDTLTVPVNLGSSGEQGISALDFRLRFDPEVFETVDVAAGSDASATGKQVLGNSITPGDYKVLMFGLNQETLTTGEIATITLRVKGTPGDGSSSLELADVTLSLPNATDIPATGGSFPVNFPGEESDPEEDTEEPPAQGEDPEPAADEEEADTPTDTPALTPAPAAGQDSPSPEPQPASTPNAPATAQADTPEPSNTATPPNRSALDRAQQLRASLPTRSDAAPDQSNSASDSPQESATAATAPPKRAEPVATDSPAAPPNATPVQPEQSRTDDPAAESPATPPPASSSSGRGLQAKILALGAAACVAVALLAIRKLIFP